ncbi:hypothetical protein GCM10022384_46430 [Streptomyces marokkonensis]|uniref:Uncharacterized protein n=1 Tax=Streptomyces marokkonensis TaxID=324855 RepID=A0ABP7R9C3_9ACTN
MGEPGVDPVPRLGLRLAVVGGLGDRGDRGLGTGLRLGEAEFRSVLGRPAIDAVHPRWLRQPHDPVGTDPANELDRQIAQDPGQTGDVIAGIAHDHDGRVPGLPLARDDEPFNDSAELARGDCGGVVHRAEPDHVQDRGP